MKICNIVRLCEDYGEDMTLGELLKRVRGKKLYKCPRCNGEGLVREKYDAYPKGLPDSGWAHDWKYKLVGCTLCNSEGYTEHEYKPRMIQDGWE